MAGPHQFEPQHNFSQLSPMRKRGKDAATGPAKPATLQIQDLDTSQAKTLGIDDNLSPRTAVSDKFQRLGLQPSLSPKKTARRTSWSANLVISNAEILQSLCGSSKTAMGIEETPEPSLSSTPPGKAEPDDGYERPDQDLSRTMVQFSAGTTTSIPSVTSTRNATPSKRARFVSVDLPSSPTPTQSPAKRRRTSTPPPPAATSIACPLSPSPFAKRRSHSPRPKSPISPIADAETDELDPDQSVFWWQPSEITGHSPSDSDEDNRGVNGIGYQKTKAEAWSIAQKKKKQLAEWRSREAKEARALRAGGRRNMGGVVSGRVTKSRSRSPAMSESGRRSPFLSKKEREEKAARAVRFEVG